MINFFGNGTVLCTAEDSNELQPIRISNTGNKILTNIEVTVTIPAGLAYSSDNPSSGTYDDITSIWEIASLGIGNTATLDLCVEVTDDTTAPWEITYVAIHDDSVDAVADDNAERNFEGFACSEFDNCYATLPEFDSMAEAIAELGPGKPFLYSEANIDFQGYRALFVTPF